jgi:hypothetical protein
MSIAEQLKTRPDADHAFPTDDGTGTEVQAPGRQPHVSRERKSSREHRR